MEAGLGGEPPCLHQTDVLLASRGDSLRQIHIKFIVPLEPQERDWWRWSQTHVCEVLIRPSRKSLQEIYVYIPLVFVAVAFLQASQMRLERLGDLWYPHLERRNTSLQSREDLE